MDSAKERETFVYLAKLSEQAGRYEEMVKTMKNAAKLNVDLTVEERNLFSVGYKNVIGSRRASWRILSSIEQKERNDVNVKRIKDYMYKVELELSNICVDIMSVLDEHLIPSASEGESKVFFNKMKGDYYRYLAEFKLGNVENQLWLPCIKLIKQHRMFDKFFSKPETKLNITMNRIIGYKQLCS